MPGCATGEEAYSIAIALLEYLGDDANSAPMQVFATDVSEEAIERARAGVYPESIAADVSPERLRRFFTRVDGHYRVSKIVRDACIFARQDLTRDPPFSKLDLIVCRNVLIYLGPRLQRKLMGVFHYALKPHGFLMLGFDRIHRHAAPSSSPSRTSGTRCIRRRPGQHVALRTCRPVLTRPVDRGPFERRAARAPRARRAAAGVPTFRAEVTRLLLGRYSPPSVRRRRRVADPADARPDRSVPRAGHRRSQPQPVEDGA